MSCQIVFLSNYEIAAITTLLLIAALILLHKVYQFCAWMAGAGGEKRNRRVPRRRSRNPLDKKINGMLSRTDASSYAEYLDD